MGKNKWYFESEINHKQAGSGQKSAPKRHKNAAFSPMAFAGDSPENMPLPKLMRLVWMRLRRSWVALRFQANRWSFGIFRRKTIVQLGILAGTGFVLLGPDGESGLLTKTTGIKAGWARETTLNVGASDDIKRVTKAPKRKSEAAPVAAGELLEVQSQDYIERFSQIAMTEMKQFGVPASISLAQGLIESRAGTSKLAVQNNNHFGMKCFSRHCKKGHCTNFTDDSHKDFFLKFENPWESWRKHSQMLSSGRYASLHRYGRDYHAWARGLKSIGYATDGGYAQKLVGIIERYQLYKYDR